MKKLTVFVLLLAGCSAPTQPCPHYFVLANDYMTSVFFRDSHDNPSRVGDYNSVKEADEAAQKMNSLLPPCKK